MNVFPNQVEASTSPVSAPSSAEENQRMMSASNSGHSGLNQLSTVDDGDLRKFSGGMASAEGGATGMLKDDSFYVSGKPKDAPAGKKTHNPSGDNLATKKRRPRKKWKKPKDKPNRPLSAYNLFFKAERAAMLGDDAKKAEQEKGEKRIHRKTHGKIGFADMARNIGQKWNDLPLEEKQPYKDRAAKEKERYVLDLKAWKEEQARLKPAKSIVAQLKAEAAEHKKSKEKSNLGQTNRKFKNSKNQQDPLQGELDKRTEEFNIRNLARIQQQQQQVEEEYLRVLQDRRMALLAGRAGMDPNMYQQYPSAAEASANALISQYQPGNIAAGMNSLNPAMGFGMGSMGMNPIGMNNMGMNMGINMGMNMGMGMNSFPASMNMMTPSDLQQFGATSSRIQQQLRSSQYQSQTRNSSSNNNNNIGGPSDSAPAASGDLSRMDGVSSQLRKSMNGRFSM